MKKYIYVLLLFVFLLLPFGVYAVEESDFEIDTGEQGSSINTNIEGLSLNTDENFCQKAIVEVAKQYYYREKNIIYNSSYLYKNATNLVYLDKGSNEYKTLNIYHNDNVGASNLALKEFSPEDATDYNRYNASCTNFTWQVYNEAFKFDFTDINDEAITGMASANTSQMMRRYRDISDKSIVPYYHKVSDTTVVSDELDIIKETLRIGDIITIMRSNGTGHTMLYIGNDSSPLQAVDGVQPFAFIESNHKKGEREGLTTETIYSYENKLAPYETHGSIYIVNASNWFDSSSSYYLFSNNITEIIIVRPLSLVAEGKECDEDFVKGYEKTYNRLKHPGLVATLSSSLDRTETVEPGEKITYTITVTNKSNENMTVDIFGDIPQYTNFVSGEAIKQNVTIAPTEKYELSYIVEVSDDDKLYGSYITNRSSVSGIDLNILEYLVAGKIDSEKAAIIKSKATNGKYSSTIDMISDIYKELYSYSGFDRFVDEDNPDTAAADALIKSVLKEYDSMKTIDDNYSNCTASTKTDKYDCTFKVYTINYEEKDEELSSMAVNNLYGGYLVSNTNLLDFNNRMLDIRVRDLQVGDILSVISYDGTGDKIYDTSSWKENIYLYIGDSKIAYIENGSIKIEEITDERPVIQNGDTYTAGAPTLIESLHGEVAYTVHRPSQKFNRISEITVDAPDTSSNIDKIIKILGILIIAVGVYVVIDRKRRFNKLNTM